MVRKLRTPAYRLHKSSGQAVVTFRRVNRYLGKHGSPESWDRYRQEISQWLARHCQPPPPAVKTNHFTCKQLAALWWLEASRRYVKNGKPTGQQSRIKQALRFYRKLYDAEPAAAFTPVCLREVRRRMIEARWTRQFINSCVGCLKTMYRWAEAEGLLPAGIAGSLSTVAPLGREESGVIEARGVEPVPAEHVEKALPELPPVLRDLVTLLHLTGMRSCEACWLRPRDVKRTGFVDEIGYVPEGCWVYDVAKEGNKNWKKGKRRLVFFGPRAQSILAPYLLRKDAAEFVFSPRDAMRSQLATYRSRKPGQKYTASAITHRLRAACRRAGVPAFTTLQLRHSRATEVARAFDGDAARAVLGHAKPGTTAKYLIEDFPRAAMVMVSTG